jgi:succinate dehydrogenase / fumarate reductase cytochrome b subunit
MLAPRRVDLAEKIGQTGGERAPAPAKGAIMADVNRGNRPLSPHLGIYRWQVPMLTSILTRITGNALLVTAILVVWWFLAASTSPDYYATANAVLTSWFGDLVLSLSLIGIWYHLLAGLRHLWYDTGRGLDLPTATMLGWGCLGGSLVLTLLTIVLV